MDELKISVIVPIYNAEEFLNTCIQSIRNQTYKNIEIILVNDGSTDRSKLICEQAVGDDPRISIINKMNAGLVSARKTGIRKASGDYICFVDSDDWIEDDMCEGYMNIIHEYNPDIIASGFAVESDNNVSDMVNLLKENYYELDDASSDFVADLIFNEKFEKGMVIPSVSNKCFRREFVKKNIISMDEAIVNGEDGGILIPTLLDANSLYVSQNCWYHYRIRDLSMSRNLIDDYFEKISILHKYLLNECSIRMCENIIFSAIQKYIKALIQYGVLKKFGIKESKKWIFPYESIKNGSEVIIYGAGEVGISYYHQLLANGYCNVSMLVDKRFEQISSENLIIESPEKIGSVNVDYIVIAINNDRIREEILQEIKEINISDHIHIIYSKPAYLK